LSSNKTAILELSKFKKNYEYFKLSSIFPPIKHTFKKVKSHYITILIISQLIYLEKINQTYNITNWDEYYDTFGKLKFAVKSIKTIVSPHIYLLMRRLKNQFLLETIGSLYLDIKFEKHDEKLVIHI
jgi:hypothetical protein